jgi:hypothetical protein
MGHLGPGDAGADGTLKLLYDLDEVNHKYHVVKVLTPAQAEKYRERLRKRNAQRLIVPVSQQVVFRTVGRGRGRRVIALRKKLNWKPKGGHARKPHEVPRFFGSNPVILKDEWK